MQHLTLCENCFGGKKNRPYLTNIQKYCTKSSVFCAHDQAKVKFLKCR